jgi:hypothetical protein
VRADGSGVRGPFGSARWLQVFQSVCPVGQKWTRGVRLGRPAGDALRVARVLRGVCVFGEEPRRSTGVEEIVQFVLWDLLGSKA